MPIYDVENRFSYYKSYSDNLLVGPSKPNMGDTIWQRSVSGSVVSGSEEYKGAVLASEFVYQQTNPFYKSGEVRYLRIASNNQQFTDSIVPDVVSLYLTGTYGAGKGVFFPAFGGAGDPAIMLLFATSSFPAITGSDNNVVSNYEYINSYPFEKKYSYVPRQRGGGVYQGTIDYEYSSGDSNVFKASPTFAKIDRQYIILGKAYLDATLPYTKSMDLVLDASGYYDPGYSTIMFPYPTNWHDEPLLSFFGSADRLDGSKLVHGIKSTGVNTVYLGIEGADVNYAFSVSWSVACEGWKYGLYNGIPTNFSCVFRQNHYGQPRDMLEGRPYTKTYNNPLIGGPLDEAGGINFISGSALSGESNNWLTASIYNSTNVAAAYTVNPYGSGIFDKEYRASQPWFDNDPRLGT